MSSASSEVRHDVAWLQPVRWTTCAVLWTVLGVLWLFPHLDLSLRGVARARIGCGNLSHRLSCWRFATPAAPPSARLGVALAADAALLTGLLDITGGPFNPFIVMYAVYIWVAAAAVSPAWAAVVSLASAVGFGWLVVDHLRPGLLEHHRLNDFPTHLFTMWFSGAGIAELVAHYVARARMVLWQRQAQLDEARERAARSERLASLTTLAAGAAHELSTPLATIAVATGELERNAARVTEPSAVGTALRDDASLIRSELDRCQSILDGMSGRVGGGLPTTLEPMTPSSIARLVQERLTDARVSDSRSTSNLRPPIRPQRAPRWCRRSPRCSGMHSMRPEMPTAWCFGIGSRGPMVRIEVQDRGAGLSPDARRRAGEPFYTTKEPGRGLGLGLFLVRSFAERSGGSLEFEGTEGITAVLEVPAVAGEAPLVT